MVRSWTGSGTLLDRQNKELKAKLSTSWRLQMKTRSKVAMQALESKIANLEEQLDVESRSQSITLFPSKIHK